MYFSIRQRSSSENNSDHKPPVFPWETEVADYPETSGDLSTPEKSPSNEPNQLKNGHIQEDPSSSPQ
jgi:hypothetical protein